MLISRGKREPKEVKVVNRTFKMNMLLAVGIMVVIPVFFMVLSAKYDVYADSSKYGTIEEEPKENVEKERIIAQEREEAIEKGTAGETMSSGVVMDSGKVFTSDVAGCYNTRQFGGSVTVSSKDEQAELDKSLNLGPGESGYAYVMDSSCGPAAKGVLYATAATSGYPTGPILDINIGKKTAAGEIVYPDSFSGPNGGTMLRYSIPAGYRKPGFEPAFICLLPDGTTKLVPNLVGGDGTFGGVFIDEPQGVYMLTQVPAGSIQDLHSQYLLKSFNNHFGTNFPDLSYFGALN